MISSAIVDLFATRLEVVKEFASRLLLVVAVEPEAEQGGSGREGIDDEGVLDGGGGC